MANAYDPRSSSTLTFRSAIKKFREAEDTPRAYLERCLETIDARDTEIQAFVTINREAARVAADASTARWRDGRPLSSIDGMPVGIKDLLETKEMPTEMGCDAYRGHFPKRDNTAVRALREAGAVICGKTVTAELGGTHPGPTRNPFDLARTPGGSSSGSAAAVASNMLPAAIGTQVGGSIIRPAGFCGNVALKPTQGAINRGERQATSMSTHGVHANCIEDMWQVAIEIARRVGGDPGRRSLEGPMSPPSPTKPDRLIMLETAGWKQLDQESKSAFELLLERLQQHGIELIRRSQSGIVEQLERATADAAGICIDITSWENRWAQRNLVDEHPDKVSARAKARLDKAEAMTPTDYQLALLARAGAQDCHRLAGSMADGVIALSCPGPAPLWPGDEVGKPLIANPTGSAVFNYPSSMLFAPAVTVPMLKVNGLPVGVQIMGQQHEDARVTAMARWLLLEIDPIVQD